MVPLGAEPGAPRHTERRATAGRRLPTEAAVGAAVAGAAQASSAAAQGACRASPEMAPAAPAAAQGATPAGPAAAVDQRLTERSELRVAPGTSPTPDLRSNPQGVQVRGTWAHNLWFESVMSKVVWTPPLDLI